jgi:acetylornithine deacetylase/succinyl-diaminopimelate desuccinylase-like protein
MEQTLAHIRASRDRYLEELTEYLAIPSISSDPDRKGDVADCAEKTAAMLKAAGMGNIKVTPTAGHPVVTGEWLKAPGRPTLLIYGHYDVQPVDPLDLWEKPPFEAHVKNDRLVARGSADDKGQVFMHLKAVESILKVEGKLPVNVKFILEGEEEIGSVNLADFLKSHTADLKADVVIISDSQMYAEGMPAITYGLRGLAYLEIEVTGPNRDLHSGSFGGTVANPAEILSRMIALLKDSNGHIQIPGFYDQVRELSKDERALLARVPFDEPAYKKDLEVAELWGEASYSPVERTWIRPTIEINGIWGGFTGVGAKTVLPAKASAKISSRLVPDQDPDRIVNLIEGYFRSIAPKSVTLKFIRHHGGHPVVAPLKTPYVTAATKALKAAFNAEPYFIREGGSIPIVADFKTILGLDTLLLGFALPDNRAHSPNENFHIPTMFTGIESLVRFHHAIE